MNLRSTWRIIPLLLFLTACELDDLVRNEDEVTANHFLSADKYTSLEIEVVYVEGFQPAAASLDNLKKTLETMVNKPGGISVVTRGIPPPGVEGYTLDKLKEIEKDHRVIFPSGSRLSTFIFFADKPYLNDNGTTRVLGLYYDHTSLAVFEKTVHDGSGGIGQPGGVVMETWVLTHEFGHALGLVSNGSPMQTPHEDPEKKGHCNNDACIMHFESDGRLLSGVPKFDDNCLADLKANGGK